MQSFTVAVFIQAAHYVIQCDPFATGGFVGGLILLIVGNVIWRIWCEFIMVLFRINKSLQDVEKNTRQPKL